MNVEFDPERLGLEARGLPESQVFALQPLTTAKQPRHLHFPSNNRPSASVWISTFSSHTVFHRKEIE